MDTSTLRRLRIMLSAAAERRRLRRTFARKVVDPTGPYASRWKPSAKVYRRHPRHRCRMLAEQMA